MKRYELTPTDGRKSFYGKAVVEIDSNGNETLYSYNTPIIKRFASGELVRMWGEWSVTTGRHIKAFCGLSKAEFTALPTEHTNTGGGYLTPKQSLKIMLARRAAH